MREVRDKGYGLLHRKFFDHPLWLEPRVFSRAEAWIDIVFGLARGTQDSGSGLQRGEFRASLSWLAVRWTWDKAKVQRFMVQLSAGDDPMLQRTVSDGPDVRVYKVCKFDKYQNSPKRETPTATQSETPSATPTETPKPLKQLPLAGVGETPPDTPDETQVDTQSETKRKERINTGEKNTSDGRHRGFIDFLFERYPDAVVGPTDYRALKDLLSSTRDNPAYALDNLQRYWTLFLSRGDDFDRQQGTSLQYFCRKINKFVRLSNGTHSGNRNPNPNETPGSTPERTTSRGDLVYVPKQ